MKKFIAIALAVAVLVGIIFAVKSCTPRVKPLTEEEELSAFVQANSEFTCLLKNTPGLEQDTTEAGSKLQEIYAQYNFPVSDDQKMMDLLNKYENNVEAIHQIKIQTENC